MLLLLQLLLLWQLLLRHLLPPQPDR